MKKQGISLVALVITIIVLIILTGAVIVTFMEGGIIDRAKEIIEIKSATGSAGAIEALTNLLGRNGNTFYYTKLLSMKPERIPTDTFNSEVIRLSNYARRKKYNPNYVYYKMREKMCLTS